MNKGFKECLFKVLKAHPDGISAESLQKKTRMSSKQLSNAMHSVRKTLPVKFNRTDKTFYPEAPKKVPKAKKIATVAEQSLELITKAAMEMPPGYQGDYIDMKIKELYHHECAERLRSLMSWAQAQKERLL